MNSPITTYGIIGHPLKHSLSSVMHNAAFAALGVEAIYKTFPLEEEYVEDFIDRIHDDDNPIFGLNVTVPYKERVVHYMDSLTPLVEKIGAVNTIVVTDKRKLVGYNTDAPGFMAHLKELQFSPEGKNVCMLGAGGSARAIIAVLCLLPKRPKKIRVYNRTPERIQQLLDDLGSRIDVSCIHPVMSVDDLDLPSADILINATSIGLDLDDPLLVDENLIQPNLLVYDLIYNPAQTPLLKLASANGARTVNGLGMLYYQGVLALQHWAGIQLEDRVKNAMREALEQAQ